MKWVFLSLPITLQGICFLHSFSLEHLVLPHNLIPNFSRKELNKTYLSNHGNPASAGFFFELRSMKKSFSYWEQSTWFSHIDICIVGAGIVGLSAAMYLKNVAPNLRIIVLEKGFLPDGASTKNAGFACFGSLSELASDLKQSTDNEVYEILKLRIQGLSTLRELLGEKAIDYQNAGGFELFRPDQLSMYQESSEILGKMNLWLKDILGIDNCYTLEDQRINGWGFSGFSHAIHNRAEGQIDTGKMIESMLRKVRALDIPILFGCKLESFDSSGSGYQLHLNDGQQIYCKNLGIATNGFAAQLLPELDVNPARAQVLVTSEIKDLPFEGCFHLEEGYYYFRNIHSRVLFGGGRNLDKTAETTYSQETTELIQNELNRILREQIIPGREFKIEYSWAGTMGIGKSKSPIVQTLENGVCVGVRMGGMGVAIGTLIGKQLAQLLINKS